MVNRKIKNKAKMPGAKPTASKVQDLWTDAPECPGLADNDWIGQTKVPGKYKQKVFKKSRPEPTAVPAVEVAAAGASVVPKEEDRQRLVVKAAAQELDKQEMRQIAQAARKQHQSSIGAQPMLTGALADDVSLEFMDGVVINKPVQNKKLTRAQRNKRDRHKERLKQQEDAKKDKNKGKGLNNLGQALSQIKQKDKQQARDIAARAQSAQEKIKYFPRKLSKHEFEEDRPEVLLQEELGGSLRSLRKESSLLKDRFQSLQKRNILAVGSKQRAGHGKHKLKVKTRTHINKNGTAVNGLKDW
eukprot:TRINITY_DN14784_c0_g1_i3.p1 TRINITY_DN14784_c0_g1~~TRINITY_DN14784_c0_g1_i3.p1  ORF type:complete len:301 (-),score=96.87 TRINITY_DN14784_c0_g1_i3:356-1258(-)